MTALLMGNILYMPHCTQLGKYYLFHVVALKRMTPAKHATVAVPGVMNTIFHASDTGVTTELQFENAIQVEWFDNHIWA